MSEISNQEMLDLIKRADKKAKKRDITKFTGKKDLTLEEKFKIKQCKIFVEYLNDNKMKPGELSRLLNIKNSRISEIIHYKITKLTVDKLFSYLYLLGEHSSKVKMHLQVLEAWIDITMMPVKKAQTLTRSINKATRAIKKNSEIVPKMVYA